MGETRDKLEYLGRSPLRRRRCLPQLSFRADAEKRAEFCARRSFVWLHRLWGIQWIGAPDGRPWTLCDPRLLRQFLSTTSSLSGLIEDAEPTGSLPKQNRRFWPATYGRIRRVANLYQAKRLHNEQTSPSRTVRVTKVRVVPGVHRIETQAAAHCSEAVPGLCRENGCSIRSAEVDAIQMKQREQTQGRMVASALVDLRGSTQQERSVSVRARRISVSGSRTTPMPSPQTRLFEKLRTAQQRPNDGRSAIGALASL